MYLERDPFARATVTAVATHATTHFLARSSPRPASLLPAYSSGPPPRVSVVQQVRQTRSKRQKRKMKTGTARLYRSCQYERCHLSSTLSQSNSGLSNRPFTTLCSSHMNCLNSGAELALTGMSASVSRRCSAHSLHGKRTLTARTKSRAASMCVSVTLSGKFVATACRNVHVARPSSGRVGGPGA
jgi:Rod binding domain-containing protein